MMNNVEKRIYISNLLSFYESLLPSSQKDVLNQYLNCDLSLSEIATNNNISRSAVEDAIKKGMRKLDELESKLNLYKNHQKIAEITAKIKEINKDKDVDSLLDELERL